LAIEGSGPIDPMPLTLCLPAGSLSELSVTYNVLAIEGSGPIDPIPLTLCFPAGSLSAV